MTRQHAARWIGGGLVALGALLVVAPVLVGGTMGWGAMTGGAWGPTSAGPMMDGAGAGGAWVPVAAIRWLLALAALVAGGFLLYRPVVGTDTADAAAGPALRELRTAYARGDLSEEEYDRRRERLEHE